MNKKMKAFVLMPFDNVVSETVFNLSTKKVCDEFRIEAENANDILTPKPIIEDIIKAINEATVIIADITGKNSNVFYELGMAHMLKQNQTIIITQDDYKSMPFDIQHFRIIKYENTISGKEEYEKKLRTMLKNILRDYKAIYKYEFDMMIHFISTEKRKTELFSLIALAKIPRPIKKNDRIEFEGHDEKTYYQSYSIDAERQFSLWISLEYAKISGDYLIITDKGKAFIEILEDKKFILDKVNEYILTPGYVPLSEREKRKKNGKKTK